MNGIKLISKIKARKIKPNSKIRVNYLGYPTKTILELTENNLIWKPSEFYVSSLWNNDYSFEIIEDKPKKIEKIEPIEMVGCNIKFKIGNLETFLPTKTLQLEITIDKINEVIDKLNYLLEKSDKEC